MIPRARHDPIDIFGSLQEPQPLRKRDLANDIEREHLDPPAKVADSLGERKAAIQLLEEHPHRRIDMLLKRHHVAHRVDARDRPFQHPMQVLVLRRKHARHHFAF